METYRIVRAGSVWLLAAVVAMFVATVLLSTPAQAQPAPSLPEVCATFAQPVVVHIEHDVPLRMVAAAVWEGYDWAQARAFLNGDSCGTPPPRALNTLPSTQLGAGEMSLRAVTQMSASMFNASASTGVNFFSAAYIVCMPGNEHAFEAHYNLVHRVPVDAGIEEDDDAGVTEDAGFVRQEERVELALDCNRVRANETEPRRWFREHVPPRAAIYIGARRGHDVVLPRGGIARPTESACRALTTLADNSADEAAITALQRALRDQEPIDASVRSLAVARITNMALDLARRLHTREMSGAFQPPPPRVETRVVYVYRDDPNLRSKASTLITLLLLALSLAVFLAGAAGAFWLEKRDMGRELVSATEVLGALTASVMKLLPPDDVRLRSLGEMTVTAAGRTALEALPEVVVIITSARRADQEEIKRLQRQLDAHHEEPPLRPANDFIIPPAPNVPDVGPGESFDDHTSVSPFPFGQVHQEIGSTEIDMMARIMATIRRALRDHADAAGPDPFDSKSFSEQLGWAFWALEDWAAQVEEARKWHAFWHGSYEDLAGEILDTLVKDDPRLHVANLDPVGRHVLAKKALEHIIADARELHLQQTTPLPPTECTRPIHRPGYTPSTPPVPSAPPDPVAPGDDTK